jgi:hypothetical protein
MMRLSSTRTRRELDPMTDEDGLGRLMAGAAAAPAIGTDAGA